MSGRVWLAIAAGIFGGGAALVVCSIFLYAWQPKVAATYLPVSTAEGGTLGK